MLDWTKKKKKKLGEARDSVMRDDVREDTLVTISAFIRSCSDTSDRVFTLVIFPPFLFSSPTLLSSFLVTVCPVEGSGNTNRLSLPCGFILLLSLSSPFPHSLLPLSHPLSTYPHSIAFLLFPLTCSISHDCAPQVPLPFFLITLTFLHSSLNTMHCYTLDLSLLKQDLQSTTTDPKWWKYKLCCNFQWC